MPVATHAQLAETIRQTVEMFKRDCNAASTVSDNLPRVAVVDAPADWKEEGYEHAVAITMEVLGRTYRALVDHEQVEHFVERVRQLRRRSTATLQYMDLDDEAGRAYVMIKRISDGYIFAFDFIRLHCVGDERVGESAKRSILLSDDQMDDLLAKLEHAAEEANVEYVEAA
ncbi:hypothetical protein [Bradyrhizobium sp. sBnM-33]|uniref:hypothetical protein n=1 Tax=Bradyrhizobium sp. sBnM-33 TaxID=2831780 RepID=UPI001BCEFD98|nr:hypothetical protein [Bradyrhizobium sp. sBnM-33]WOH50692.1 hypothetical protein RX328_42955 [Bradyrhizobium sp. sBnM-33]